MNKIAAVLDVPAPEFVYSNKGNFSIAKALGMSVEETEKLLREAVGEQEEKKTGD